MSVVSSEQQNKTKRIGCVKWFNNKSGYGFITVLNDNVLDSKDIFVHHTSINAKGDIYKYLVQGEYVEFDVQRMESKDHENQAIQITGVYGGDLMCETRSKNRDLSKSNDGFTQVRLGRRTITANE